ncbi:MAG: glycoside hydrolase family 9 protein [Paludibacteraceae bacterium]|nr:glycoside hydrolase family 9 protein [Paludibacteraceae bacterium]
MGCKHTTSPAIRLNQVGYAPEQEKTATILVHKENSQPYKVNIHTADNKVNVLLTASEEMRNPVSGKLCQIVDFSQITEPGEYIMDVLLVPEPIWYEPTHFIIAEHPYHELTRKALRAFYYQRASMPIEEPYAEGFSRPAGHPDDHVLVHASAATAERPENTVISCPGGWYDAGDYNKYIVNSGFTMGVFLMAYEMNREYFDTLRLNIPESGQPVPDMLAEAMYNIRWMLTMQDLDGGVYHKLTEPDFEGFIRPDECKKPRYVVLKTTAAALDFAATMALAARVYAPFEDVYPGFVAQATDAALKAYAWAEANPEVYYDQPKMNEQFTPAITTGAYDDFDVTDEFYWAATELYLLTKDEKYKEAMLAHQPKEFVPASWGKVAELAYLEQLTHPDSRLSTLDSRLLTAHLAPYLDEAETISVYRSPYGNHENDFFWGCNSEGCCWRGVECLYAYRLTGDKRYLVNAERCLNYILGQNATGYCYVTGFGTKPTSDPHHRVSFSHPKGTHPGFLAGGPNPARQDAVTDGVKYPKDVPADESYLDYQPSYASNEVTINWNVTLFALSGGLDALDALE